MQALEQNEPQATVAMRLRKLLILWCAIFLSIPIYYVFSIVEPTPDGVAHQNRTLTIILASAGLLSVVVSHLVKQKYLNHSVAQQSIALFQVAYVVGFALSEVPALLGLLDHFVTGNRYYYVLFIIATIGMALHFPRRDHLLAACYKSQLQNL
jgi:hypothetical protein